MIEQAIHKLLTDNANVTKRVRGRIYPQVAPPKAKFPRITYTRITATHYRHSAGISGLANATIQIDCWSDKYWDVKSLAEDVRLALDAFRGTVGSFKVRGIFLDSDQDLHTSPIRGDSRGTHQQSMDFNCFWAEATE